MQLPHKLREHWICFVWNFTKNCSLFSESTSLRTLLTKITYLFQTASEAEWCFTCGVSTRLIHYVFWGGCEWASTYWHIQYFIITLSFYFFLYMYHRIYTYIWVPIYLTLWEGHTNFESLQITCYEKYMMGLKKLKTTDSRPILPFDRWGNWDQERRLD